MQIKKDPSESYMHHAAKMVLVSWLREVAEGEEDNWVRFAGCVDWRVNRGAPHYGVFDEYPLDEDFCTVWDERDWRLFPHQRDWPDYEWMKKNSKKPFRIADVAIQHKGAIEYLFEIVHKNVLSKEKRDFYRRLSPRPQLFVIPAHWILGQTEMPSKMPKEFAA